jgi:CspA family cold shock protein
MAKGTIKWFDTQKGYGFIAPEAGGKDVFVHVSGLAPGVSALDDGEAVVFQVTEGRKGLPVAVGVRPA